MGTEVSQKIRSLLSYLIQCCKIIQYKIESNEEVTSDKNRFKKLRKYENKSGDLEYIPEIIQEELYIDDLSENNEEKKTESEKQERSIFDIIKIKDLYNKSKILKLEMSCYNNSEQNNKNDKENKKIYFEINPLGYPNSKRKKDGITFFGYDKEGDENNLDIMINPSDNEVIDDQFLGKHFQIKFKPEDLNYYLKDLGHGFGTFIKITDWVEIKNNFLLNIGENYLVFSLGYENERDISENYILKYNKSKNDNILNVKIFSYNPNNKNFSFTSDNSPFTIGRKDENAINIEDNMLSRIHCTVKYKNNKWYIQDGDEREEGERKKSTNGSWVYAFEDCLITDKMIFKSGRYIFGCKLVDINNSESEGNARKE